MVTHVLKGNKEVNFTDFLGENLGKNWLLCYNLSVIQFLIYICKDIYLNNKYQINKKTGVLLVCVCLIYFILAVNLLFTVICTIMDLANVSHLY